MRLRLAVIALALVCAGSALHATSITYDFTYKGIGYDDPSAKANGSGSITFDVGANDKGTISAFNFTDIITSSAGSSTFTYDSATLSGKAIFTGSGANLTLTNVQFLTPLVAGTNANFGKASFTASYSGVSDASTAGTQTSADWLSDFTWINGGGSFTFSVAPPAPHLAATPEPSSLLLLGTGILGAFGAARRRFIA
jgi:hypothetical protein